MTEVEGEQKSETMMVEVEAGLKVEVARGISASRALAFGMKF